MSIVKINITTEPQLTEVISDFLMGVVGAAVEFEVDDKNPGTIIHGFLILESVSGEVLEQLRVRVEGYSAEMAEIFRVNRPEVTVETVPEQDWSKNWKKYFKPFAIVPGLVIAPSWETYDCQAGEQVMIMDPGMAFGTGHHASTRLCLELIQTVSGSVKERAVLDVGTGTGILGMAAAMWGSGSVLGIDNDPEAVAAARDNVAMNDLGACMTVAATPVQSIEVRYRLVVANIIHDVLVEMSGDLCRVTEPGGWLILSGLLYGEQTKSMVGCFEEKGFRLIREKQDGEWGALLFVKEA